MARREGVTPAGSGTLGLIPNTMADPGCETPSLGDGDSVNSTSHGAGRRMSRSQAFKTLNEAAWRGGLQERGISPIGGSLDGVPRAYKDIGEVMCEQASLVEILGRFRPALVRMDGSRPRRRRR